MVPTGASLRSSYKAALVAALVFAVGSSPGHSQLQVVGFIENPEPRVRDRTILHVSLHNPTETPANITRVEIVASGLRPASQTRVYSVALAPGQSRVVRVELEATVPGETNVGIVVEWTTGVQRSQTTFHLGRLRIRENWWGQVRDALIGGAAVLVILGAVISGLLELSRRRWEVRREREAVVQSRIQVVAEYIRDHYSQIASWAWSFCHEVSKSVQPLTPDRVQYLSYLLAKLMWMEDKMNASIGGYFFRDLVGEGVLTELVNDLDEYIVRSGPLDDENYSAVVRLLGPSESYVAFRNTVPSDPVLQRAYSRFANCVICPDHLDYIERRVHLKQVLLLMHIARFNEDWYQQTVTIVAQPKDDETLVTLLGTLIERHEFDRAETDRYRALTQGYLRFHPPLPARAVSEGFLSAL